MIDLHLHTTSSDGLLGPEEMVRLAAQKGIDVMAVTDHDNVSGLAEALEAGRRWGVEVIPGIELSVGGEEEIHLLAYGIDPENPKLLAYLDGLMEERRQRGVQMLENLKTAGIELTMEEATNPQGDFVGRAAVARSLVKRGLCKNTRAAFDKYLTPGKVGYVPRKKIGVDNGVMFFRSIGAVTSLAHPGRMTMKWHHLKSCLLEWQQAGLDALEAWHSSHARGDGMMYEKWARENGFMITGGSDCHGKFQEVDFLQGLQGWESFREDTARLKELCQRRKQQDSSNCPD